MAGGSEFALHVIDGEIAFAHGHGQITNAVAGGRGLRSALRLAEEGSAFLRVVAELMAEDAEGAGGVAEAAGDFGRRAPHRRSRRGGLRTGAARGTEGKGRSSGCQVSLSDLQCWTPYIDSATKT